jgi:hypothetical protein
MRREKAEMCVALGDRKCPQNSHDTAYTPGEVFGDDIQLRILSADANAHNMGVSLSAEKVFECRQSQFSTLNEKRVTKQAAEKLRMKCERHEKHPSGPKGRIHFEAFTARLKPCPFKTSTHEEFFRSL